MKKIGMVVAVEDEAMVDVFGLGVELPGDNRVILHRSKDALIYTAYCGAGEIFAAAATQLLIDRYDVSVVINWGVAGACSAGVKIGEVLVVDRVIHYQYDLSGVDGVPVGRYPQLGEKWIPLDQRLVETALDFLPWCKIVTCASGDKFVADESEKARLNKEHEADICDMESAAVALVCARNNVPCLIVKSVSDALGGGADEYWSERDRSATVCVKAAKRVIGAL